MGGVTSMAGSDKTPPSPNSWKYPDVMQILKNLPVNQKKFILEIDGHMYRFQKSSYDDAYGLCEKLADQVYDSIRESDMDISTIVDNLSFRADNIKKIKDYIFYIKHYFDRYDDSIEYKRFDSNLKQALA